MTTSRERWVMLAIVVLLAAAGAAVVGAVLAHLPLTSGL